MPVKKTEHIYGTVIEAANIGSIRAGYSKDKIPVIGENEPQRAVILEISHSDYQQNTNSKEPDELIRKNQLLKIALSRKQFNDLITGLNNTANDSNSWSPFEMTWNNDHTPCTITSINGVNVPQEYVNANTRDEFRNKLQQFKLRRGKMYAKYLKESYEILQHKKSISKGNRQTILDGFRAATKFLTEDLDNITREFSNAIDTASLRDESVFEALIPPEKETKSATEKKAAPEKKEQPAAKKQTTTKKSKN